MASKTVVTVHKSWFKIGEFLLERSRYVPYQNFRKLTCLNSTRTNRLTEIGDWNFINGVNRHMRNTSTASSTSTTNSYSSTHNKNNASSIQFSSCQAEQLIGDSLILQEDFISSHEEELLLKEVLPYMKRLRYEYSHWDDVRRLIMYVVLLIVVLH